MPAIRKAVMEFAISVGAVPALVPAVKLAVSEVLSNVVVHAYPDAAEPGPMIVEAWTSDGSLFVIVRDEGGGIRPRPDSPGLGLGLPLIAHTADDFRLEDRPDQPGTRFSLRFSLDGSGISS